MLVSLGPACWLWDYLRRSRTQGYFLPLSGGIDSCATAVIVHSMCRLVAQAARSGGMPQGRSSAASLIKTYLTDEAVISDARRIAGEAANSQYTPSDPREFANRVFHTCYMGTENSSAETRNRAKDLAQAIGRYENSSTKMYLRSPRRSYHTDLNMDSLVTAIRNLFGIVTGYKPQFRAHGGSNAENLALQNIQVS